MLVWVATTCLSFRVGNQMTLCINVYQIVTQFVSLAFFLLNVFKDISNSVALKAWPVIVNKLHHKKVVGRWSVSGQPTTYRPPTDHLPSTYRPPTDHLPTTYQPTDHQRSFKDPSKDCFTKVFFIFHFRCFLCCDRKMP